MKARSHTARLQHPAPMSLRNASYCSCCSGAGVFVSSHATLLREAQTAIERSMLHTKAERSKQACEPQLQHSMHERRRRLPSAPARSLARRRRLGVVTPTRYILYCMLHAPLRFVLRGLQLAEIRARLAGSVVRRRTSPWSAERTHGTAHNYPSGLPLPLCERSGVRQPADHRAEQQPGHASNQLQDEGHASNEHFTVAGSMPRFFRRIDVEDGIPHVVAPDGRLLPRNSTQEPSIDT